MRVVLRDRDTPEAIAELSREARVFDVAAIAVRLMRNPNGSAERDAAGH